MRFLHNNLKAYLQFVPDYGLYKPKHVAHLFNILHIPCCCLLHAGLFPTTAQSLVYRSYMFRLRIAAIFRELYYCTDTGSLSKNLSVDGKT